MGFSIIGYAVTGAEGTSHPKTVWTFPSSLRLRIVKGTVRSCLGVNARVNLADIVKARSKIS